VVERLVHPRALGLVELRAHVDLGVLHVRVDRVRPAEAGAVAEALVGGDRVVPAVLVAVHDQPDTELAEVGQAGDALGLLAGGAERREQDRDQQRDDTNNDQQLDEGERVAGPRGGRRRRQGRHDGERPSQPVGERRTTRSVLG
jgi:hypothetical protein